ncbi:MAG: hypothetical protein H0U70_03425 [Tatlockia sp.]|nr:hypothetical protein [Tatlockia sp.]
MRLFKLKNLLLGLILLLNHQVIASNEQVDLPKAEINDLLKKDLSLNALQAYWAFSGLVSTENGDLFNYYFQMQRKDSHFHAVAALIDSQTKEILLFEESSAKMEHFVDSNWRVGRAFMQFNPINNSWVFGVTPKDHKGFNFKVDMLGQSLSMPMSQGLRSGIELLINQTGRLNGHLQVGDKSAKDQFVTAPKAWFKQIWVSKSQETVHPLTGVLCQFNDGSAFFSVNLQEADALKGAIAGWRDEQGTVIPMSQFVSIQEKQDGLWSIRIPSPKISLSFQDSLAKGEGKHQLIAGFTKDELPGFCTITKDEIGEEVPPKIETKLALK